MFLSPVFTVSWEMLMFLEYSMEDVSFEASVLMLFAVFFRPVFRRNEQKCFKNFAAELIFPNYHCLSKI